jgi:hypothetical protein
MDFLAALAGEAGISETNPQLVFAGSGLSICDFRDR